MTPDVVTVTSTDYTTVIETTTATTVTDTFSTTSTDYSTSTTTATVTATETSTTDVSTTTTSTTVISPTAVFYDTFDTLDGYPSAISKQKRSKCKDRGSKSSSTLPISSGSSSNATYIVGYPGASNDSVAHPSSSLISSYNAATHSIAGPSGSPINSYNATSTSNPMSSYSAASHSLARPSGSPINSYNATSTSTSTYEPQQTVWCTDGATPEDSGLYPTAVSCSATIQVTSTTTVTSTGLAVTTTADADTTTTTVTSTITSTSTVVPGDVSTTLSFSTTSTITETTTSTATVTTTLTNANVVTSTTSAYSMCTDSANLIQPPFTDPAGHNAEFYYFTASASYTISVGDATSFYSCCNSCATLGLGCGVSYYLPSSNVCYVLKPSASSSAQSSWYLTAYTRPYTGSAKVGLANGLGGYVLEHYVS